jgi:hypothetical protein
LKFLGRAKNFLQGLGPEPSGKVQYFNVACAAGHRVRGERTEGYQALRCPACGEGVFVLPRSPLPEPDPPPGVRRSRGASGRSRRAGADDGPVELSDPAYGAVEVDGGGAGQGEAEIVWDDEPAGASTTGAPASPRFAPEDLAAAEIDAARRKESVARAREGRRAVEPGVDAGTSGTARTRPDGSPAVPTARARREPVRTPGAAGPARPRREPADGLATAPQPFEARSRPRHGPPVGLIFLLLAMLIGIAVGWRVWRNYREQLPRVIERGRVEGLPALEAGEFDRANQLLSAARAAVDTLGGGVEDAEEIRDAAKEAAIFVNICPEKLEDMLAEAGRTDHDTWAIKFETLYKGHSCIFDTLIEATSEDGGNGAYQIAYIVFPPGESTRFGDAGRPDKFATIDLAGFELFENGRPGKESQVKFGAKLRSMEYDSEQKHWVVRLEPKSGVFIKHYRALQVIGWPDPDMVQVPQAQEVVP